MEGGPYELPAVPAEHLKIPPGPALPLTPGLGEGDGLLVKKLRVHGDAYLPAVHHGVDGELDVLGEQVEGPAPVGLKKLAADHEASAGDGGAVPGEDPGVI